MYETNVAFDYAKEPSRDILCIDCKSFYASVECVQRGLNPLETKLVVLSYPSDDPKQRGSGVILASSPAAKKAYGISNVSRARDLPFPYPPDLFIAAPRMRLYMQKNKEINDIYKRYADESNHHVYSVDESFIDVTGSLKLYGRKTAREMAQLIQTEVLEKTGIYTTIGIGDNLLLAKLALDNAAKYQADMIAEWRYEDIPETIWKIPDMTDFWGIGKKTEKRLNHLGIFSLYDLAQANYYYVKSKLGLMGAQLYAHAWGIDRSFLGEEVKVNAKSIGNSQILIKDYVVRSEIEIVLMEMADQVATRLRRAGAKTQIVRLSIGYSIGYLDRHGRTGFHQQMKIPPTHSSRALTAYVLLLFDNHFEGQTIRNIGVGTGNLVYTDSLQLELFGDPEEQVNDQKKDQIVDAIRKRYGFTSLVRAASLLEGARAIARSSLVGGHAGGLAGLEEGEDHAKKTKQTNG